MESDDDGVGDGGDYDDVTTLRKVALRWMKEQVMSMSVWTAAYCAFKLVL